MSIGVQSYPELYTMLLGWSLYGKLWTLLTQTGIAYLPFIGLILKNVAKSYVMHGHHGTGHALRSMELNFITTLLLIYFGVTPFIPLDARTISYSPICENEQYYPGGTKTTYDKAFAIPNDDIRVPIWWYAIIAVSEGATNAANNAIGCVPNLRKMVTEVNMTKISDPEIKEELLDFETMCYVPAKTQFLNDTRSNSSVNLTHIKDNVKKYGVEDTEWAGSHAFNQAYYRNLKSTLPVPGFPYEASDDINADSNKAHAPAYGTPSCFEWWNHSEFGLRKRLYNALPDSFNNEFKDYIKTEEEQDHVVRTIISHTPDYANANNTIESGGYSNIATALGIWYHQLDAYPKIYAAAQAAPIIQALLLLMIYVFLPFALVFSSYRPSAFITGGILIFSLIFWSFIWHLVSWTDKSLMEALYAGWLEKQGAGATLADMVIGSLVIVAPLFWFMFMGAMGVAAGDIVGSTSLGLNKIGENAASTGSSIAQQAVKNTATVGAKAISVF